MTAGLGLVSCSLHLCRPIATALPGCRVDGDWHHVAVTWRWDSGEVQVYFDGEQARPFWASRAGDVQVSAALPASAAYPSPRGHASPENTSWRCSDMRPNIISQPCTAAVQAARPGRRVEPHRGAQPPLHKRISSARSAARVLRRLLQPAVCTAGRHGAAEGVEPSADKVSERAGGEVICKRGSEGTGVREGQLPVEHTFHTPIKNHLHMPTARSRDEVAAGMFTADPRDKSGLVASYSFEPSHITQGPDGKVGGCCDQTSHALLQSCYVTTAFTPTDADCRAPWKTCQAAATT